MKSKEKRNFMLGSLILVLVISIGYFGISSASNTYAIDSGTSDTDATGGSCYYCSSNAPLKRYVWSSTTPTTACSGGNWRIKESRDTSSKCKSFTCNIYYKGENGLAIGIDDTIITDFGTITTSVPTKSGYIFDGWKIGNSTYSSGANFSCDTAGNYSAFAIFHKKPCKWTTATACENANPGYKCRSTDGTCWMKGDPISYTISYNANGGSGAPGSQTKTHGTDLTLSSTKPTRNGYKFSKWTTGKDGSGTSYAPGATYNANASITLYAQWISACKWTTADACQKANPGYTCKSTGTDGACWDVDKPSTYTISYNANGGSGAPGSQTKTHGTDLKLSSTKPTRSGYTFVNWNTKSDGSGTNYASGATYNTNANITLYAIWKTNSSGGDTTTKYTVSYNANGGSGTPSNQTKTQGTNLVLSSTKPTRSGYTFVNWNTKGDGTGKSYAPGATYSTDANLTLYAIWKTNASGGPVTKKYTIKFDANGGTGTTKEVVCDYGSKCTLTGNAFTRDGYEFTGWNTKSDGNGVSYRDGAVVKDLSSVDGSIVTLYAKWKANDVDVEEHVITFIHNDGTNRITVLAVDDNDTIPFIIPDRDGYEFAGWYTDVDLTKKYDFTTKVKGDITLYAKWTEDGYSSDKTDEEISNNSKTGDVMMFIAWTVGIGALAYTVYYYKTRKEN
jgi:leucine-rich repeat (lrr) protein